MSVGGSPEEQLISGNYNSFFHPNICHVCKLTNQNGLKLCRCYMISYCCEQHRMQHRSQHKEICEIIVNVSKQRNIWNTRFMTVETWAQFKMANMQCMKQKLRRDLEPYEEQMFLFAKSCIVCRKQDNLIIACDSCISVNVCNDHLLTPFEHTCVLLRHNLSLDSHDMLYKENYNTIPEKFLYINDVNIYDMSSFIRKTVQRDRNSTSWTDHDYIYTDVFSTPLTLFYGMRDADLLYLLQGSSFFIVHIITENVMDTCNLSAWEIILHELCPNTKLQIIMIGPKLQESCQTMQVCGNCFDRNKSLEYECHSVLYHNFANSLHMRPDIILGFDVEFTNNDTSVETLKAIQRQRCPFFLTSNSKHKAQKNVMQIQIVLNLPLMPIITKENEFRSCRPYRNYKNDSVFFHNFYLTIYLDLIVIRVCSNDENELGK